MVVIDTSAIVDLLIEVDIEFLGVLRRLVSSGHLSTAAAIMARDDFAQLPIARYPHVLLADRVWALRSYMTVVDAGYVALAELLGLPLVTSDRRLAGSTGHDAVIESFARRRPAARHGRERPTSKPRNV